MFKKLYDGLRNFIGYCCNRPTTPDLHETNFNRPISADQIRIVYSPPGLIEAGQRVMRQRYLDQKRLEGQLEKI